MHYLKYFACFENEPIFALPKTKGWPVRLRVRTPPFHGGDTGSNPVRATKEKVKGKSPRRWKVPGIFYFSMALTAAINSNNCHSCIKLKHLPPALENKICSYIYTEAFIPMIANKSFNPFPLKICFYLVCFFSVNQKSFSQHLYLRTDSAYINTLLENAHHLKKLLKP